MPDREDLGRLVRETWVEFAREQDDPKPSHLAGWNDLDEANREVDRRIGERVAAAERARIVAVLRRAAAGRREYAGRGGSEGELGREIYDRLMLAAACYEGVAKLIEDPAHILDVIPAWRFTREEIASLRGANGG